LITRRICRAAQLPSGVEGCYNGPACDDKRFPAHVLACCRALGAPRVTAASFLSSKQALRMAHAVAALLVLEDGRYILQLRDDLPQIWYPGHWGLFGGAIDNGEDELTALRRELKEELELEVGEAHLFTTFRYDLAPLGLDKYIRSYFVVPVSLAAWERVVVHEGSDARALTGEQALSLPRISPYDAFALFLHYQRHRLEGSIYAA
jgi:8-oxo-dGTP pyrophosphatase MutT (NUDIX family)